MNNDLEKLKGFDYKNLDVGSVKDIRDIPGIYDISVKDRKPSKGGLIVIIVLYCIAVVVLMAGVSQNIKTARKNAACTELVTGVCVKEYQGEMYFTHRGIDANNRVPYQDFKYEYEYGGKKHTVTGRIKTENYEPKVVGESYGFYVDPRDPENVYIPEAMNVDVSGKIITYIGGFMIVMVTVMAVTRVLKSRL